MTPTLYKGTTDELRRDIRLLEAMKIKLATDKKNMGTGGKWQRCDALQAAYEAKLQERLKLGVKQ
jgi:hypothetical protein